tara:strand:- start:222 stop:482 length:261 start_codon:yes stop_codon:yes gene_type:complete
MISLEASKISEKKIWYECPFCFTNGKNFFNSNMFKNGKVSVVRKPTIHHHGNETQKLENFTTTRTSHCNFNKEEVEINITDNTIRI